MATCPFRRPDCHGHDFTLIATKMREGEGRIVQCPRCSLVMQDLNWSSKDAARYYNDEYQRTNSLVSGVAQSPAEHFEDRVKTIEPIFRDIEPLLKPDMDVLEVGCGAGELLSLMKPRVRRCVGVELNGDFVRFISSTLGIEACAEEITRLDFGSRRFNLIVCVDSLDHMPNPLEVLIRLRTLLAPDGLVWLSVPNLDEALNVFLPRENRERYREFFWHRAHFFFFNQATLVGLLDAAGFDASVKCRHQYTLKNFLQWYFAGAPQRSFVEASQGVALLPGDDPFETELNQLFQEIEPRFQEILSRNRRGDVLWCVAAPEDAGTA